MDTEGWGNVGPWDRLARIVVGVTALVGAGWLGVAPAATAAIEVLAFAVLATGMLGWDPIYALLRRETRMRR